ncbi:MAG: heavy metal translocating P-type ATPase [Bacteroidales bacterium]
MAKDPCIHCGEECGRSPVISAEKHFCCQGCVTVYSILDEKNLGQYYEIAPMQGIKVETETAGRRYAFLDLPEFREQLVDFSDGGISKVTFFIPSIHCSSCIWLLENLHRLNSSILYSFVNFVRKEVYITFREPEFSLRQLAELLYSIHYIPEITADKKRDDSRSKIDNRLILKIGIAGFCFGNIMLLSFPEYMPGGVIQETTLRRLFGVLVFILSLPVVFYCSTDYFTGAYKSIRKKIVSIDFPIALGIITMFIYSSVIVFTHTGPGYFDSLAGLLFFMLIGRWFQGKTYQALSFERDYKSYFPMAVTKMDGDVEIIVPLKDIIPGDIIQIRNQELIPADAVITKGQALIDYSFVTGEAAPMARNIGEHVFAGGRQTGSRVTLLIEKSVEQSYLTQLWNEDKMHDNESKNLEKVINNVSHYFTIIILMIGFAAGTYWMFTDPNLAIKAFTSVLIIACPCALALTVPFTLGSTMRFFGRKGLYVKNMDVVEKLYKTDTVVFDKTGTITYGKSLEVEFIGETLSAEEQGLIRSLSRNSTHPVSIAVTEALPLEKLYDVRNFREIPSMGISGEAEGRQILIGSRKFVTGRDASADILATEVHISIDHKVRGYFVIRNHYRNGLDKLMKDLSSKYDLHLLSGDNDSERLSLAPYFTNDKMHFSQTPADKLAYVANLRKEGRHVLMIGDGLNDAGALMESNVGISIADDIYHFSPACDAILESSRFANLYKLIRFTTTSLRVVRASFVISFFYNVIGLSFAVRGMLSPVIAAILMPVSSVTVVAFCTFSVAWFSRRVGDSNS